MSCECVSLRLDGMEEKPKTQHKEVNAQCPTQWPATESCFQRRKDHPMRVPRPHAPQPHPHAFLERRLQWIQEDRVTAWLETLQNDSNDSKWDCVLSRPTISFATRGLQADPSVTQGVTTQWCSHLHQFLHMKLWPCREMSRYSSWDVLQRVECCNLGFESFMCFDSTAYFCSLWYSICLYFVWIVWKPALAF